MEILWWLVPSVVVTAIASGWVAWLGRARPAARDDAKFAEALQRDSVVRNERPARRHDRSTGLAVRR